MAVSKNMGENPPKWMVKIMEHPIKTTMIWGVFSLFLETPIYFLNQFLINLKPPTFSKETAILIYYMFWCWFYFGTGSTLCLFKRAPSCNNDIVQNSLTNLRGFLEKKRTCKQMRLTSAYPCTLAMREVEALRLALGNIAVQKGVPGSDT